MRRPLLIDFADAGPPLFELHQGFSQGGFHVARGSLSANPGSRFGAPQMTAVVHEGEPFLFEWRRPDTGRLERTEVRAGAVHINAGHRPFYQRWTGSQRVLVMAFDRSLVEQVGIAFGGKTDADIGTVIGTRDMEIETVAGRLRRELDQTGPSGSLVLEATAQLLLVHLFRNYSHASGFAGSVKGGLDPRRLSRVLDFIDANISHEVTLSSLANVAGLSAHHFSSSFKAATGMPPYRFLLRRRVERAMEYLVTTDRTIADIAHELCFPSHAHMSTHFKRILGVQPSSFRREWRSRSAARKSRQTEPLSTETEHTARLR
jgi:AraC-like DNA-binding protein